MPEILKRQISIKALSGEKTRRLYIYLPDDYETDAGARYPVMYMFDGHNVFFDEDAAFGKSWGMTEYMLKAKKHLMIVAVECNTEGHKRLEEYSPVDFVYEPAGHIKGNGKAYMDWLVNELKPAIDREFRTLPAREHTFISGSSMGGLMALYAALAYKNVFSKAACLSPSLWIAPEKVKNLLDEAGDLSKSIVYIDYGSEEMGNHAASKEALLTAVKVLFEKNCNVSFRIVDGGTHSEASWEKQIPVFMECLGI